MTNTSSLAEVDRRLWYDVDNLSTDSRLRSDEDSTPALGQLFPSQATT